MGARSNQIANSTPFSSIINIAEQLKLPLVQILHELELQKINIESDMSNIEVSAEYALKLIDNYLLSLRLESADLEFNLEPISVSSVLYDSAESLDKLAKQYGINLELELNNSLKPVMANRLGLQSALTSVGASLVESIPAQQDSDYRLKLSSYKCRYGIVAGFYLNSSALGSNLLKIGRSLMQVSRQPIPNLSPSAGAGIFVAENIFKAMNLNLRVSKHHDLYGLGTVLKMNDQLHLI